MNSFKALWAKICGSVIAPVTLRMFNRDTFAGHPHWAGWADFDVWFTSHTLHQYRYPTLFGFRRQQAAKLTVWTMFCFNTRDPRILAHPELYSLLRKPVYAVDTLHALNHIRRNVLAVIDERYRF